MCRCGMLQKGNIYYHDKLHENVSVCFTENIKLSAHRPNATKDMSATSDLQDELTSATISLM